MMNRNAVIERKTKETSISVSIDLNGGERVISTGIGFFDHMLDAFACHAGIGLYVQAQGDLQVDCHHTIEDVGIVLGQAIASALGDKTGITRFASAYVPMDEALAFCAVDVSGRPYLVYQADIREARCGDYDTVMTGDFFRAVAFNAGLTLHLKCEYGCNAHHVIEAMFKAFARALRQAAAISGGGMPSTKGSL